MAGSMCFQVRMPRSAATARTKHPEKTAVVAISQSRMCARDSAITSWPGCVCRRMAIWLPMVPEGTNKAASRPNFSAARCSSKLTVGSSPYTSSPTSAAAIAARIWAVGRVTVSERRSIMDGIAIYSPFSNFTPCSTIFSGLSSIALLRLG